MSQLRYGLRVVLLFAVYWTTAKLGLEMDAVGGVATAVWPPTGIALVALWRFGYRLWPGIALAALAVNAERAPFFAAVGMAAGNTLEAVLATFLLQRLVGFQPSLRRLRDVVGLVLLAALPSTLVSASVGVTSGWLGGTIKDADYGRAWATWWVGDLVADLVLAPLLFVWLSRPRLSGRLLEAGVLLIVLIGVSLSALGIVPLGAIANQAYIVFPVLIWAAVRFGQPGGVAATFLVSALAIAGTTLGLGPFVRDNLGEALLTLQAFMGIVAVTVLVLAAVVEEREEAQAALRDLYDNAPDLFLSIDGSGTVVKCNQTFLTVTGYAREDIVGRPVFALHHPDSLPQAREALQHFLRTGVVRDVDLQLLCKDGSVLDVSLNMSSVRDEQGQVVSSRSVWRDISARKRAEVRLRWALREKETLLREVNHRVRNNLAVIDSILKMQAQQATEPVLAAALRDSRNRVRSIAIVHETLYRAKELAHIDFAEFIQCLSRHLFRAYGVDPNQIQLQLVVKKVEMDLELAIPLGLLVNELVTNSLKHAFADGRRGWIRVELDRQADGPIVLAVRDNGVGLPPDVQLDQPRSLGFDVVNSLVKQIDAQLELKRQDGTAVTITCLPPATRTSRSWLDQAGVLQEVES